MNPVRSDGLVAALPVSAALTLLLAHRLPLQFEYVPNELGIVSLSTLAGYPHQQETFWLAFALIVGALLAWGLARALCAARIPVAELAVVELSAAASLLAALLLPQHWVFWLLAGAAIAVATRARRSAGEGVPLPEETPSSRSRRRLLFVWAVALLLGLALNPGFARGLAGVVQGVPDEQRLAQGFGFQGELGQHLAWANALLRGGFHGRDFFCLYGPLYDLGGVASWKLFGRSIVAWDLYFAATRVAAFVIVFALAAAPLRRPVFALLVPLFVPWINLRVALGFAGLLLLGGWLRDGRLWRVALAGAVAGVALLYSQEFGLAFLVTAALALLLRFEWRPAATFAAALAAALAPVLLWYAANGALGPMLAEVVAYPGYMLAGYGKVPFPGIASVLPLDWTQRYKPEFLLLRLGPAVAAICLGGLLLALPVSRLGFRRPLDSARQLLAGLRAAPDRMLLVLVAVYGLLAFRSLLGRSDVSHLVATLPAAVMLLAAAADRLFGAVWRDPGARVVAAWRAGALALFVALAGFNSAAHPLGTLRQTQWSVISLFSGRHFHPGAPNVASVASWIRRHTEPDDAVLFLPNDAAYYYLADRPNPIRFVMGHQIVTQDHRDEVLSDLDADPPRFLVWDHAALRVDRISDELVFGRPLLDWLDAHYEDEVRLGDVAIRRLREPATGGPS